MSKLYRARSLLYRRQSLQVNVRWKALDEIYKIYMFLHRSDLNISANVRQFMGAFSTLEMLKRLQLFANFVAIFADFNEICSDFLEIPKNSATITSRNLSISISI